MELLAPPDIEPAVVAVLSVDQWRVGTEYRDHPAGSIRVSATGGGRPVDRVVVAPTVLVECWHEDETQAWLIARTAWARLNAAEGRVAVWNDGGVVAVLDDTTTLSDSVVLVDRPSWAVDLNRVESTLPVNYPDANRLQLVRYQFVTTIHTRLIPLEG